MGIIINVRGDSVNLQKFIEQPQKILNGQSPQELAQTEAGREKLKERLAEIELLAELDYNNNTQIISNINQVRDKLGLEKPENVFQDQVEELLVDRMGGDLFEDYISKAILMWRNYKGQTDKIRGQAKSWAAAVEYLICRLNCWQGTQEYIGNKYNVCMATISQKYRQLAADLDSNLNLSSWRELISVFNQ